jgi:hypothetical protein
MEKINTGSINILKLKEDVNFAKALLKVNDGQKTTKKDDESVERVLSRLNIIKIDEGYTINFNYQT